MAFRNSQSGVVFRINLVTNTFSVNNGAPIQWSREDIESLCNELTAHPDWVRFPSGDGIFRVPW